MFNLKSVLLFLAFFSLLITKKQNLFCTAIEEEFTTEPTNQELIPSLQNYQPNNVVEISGPNNIFATDFENLTNKTAQELLPYFKKFESEPNLLLFDAMLMSKTASILIPRTVINIWIKIKEAITTITQEKLQKMQQQQNLENITLENYTPEKHHSLNQENTALLNLQKRTLGLYHIDLLREWNIYQIKNSIMFLLIPSFANLSEVKKFFCISNKSICKRLFSINDILENSKNRTQKLNQLKIQTIKQPRNKQINKTLTKNIKNLYLKQNCDWKTFSQIFQPNSNGWIFFRQGHGSPFESEESTTFCGTSFKDNFDRMKFLGTQIKTFINFDLTCFGGAENASLMEKQLYTLNKNQTFSPYIYGIYALSAHVTTFTKYHHQHQKYSNFFTQLRNFEKTKQLIEFKNTVQKLISFSPILTSYDSEEYDLPEISNYGISGHPLIFIPSMKNFTALPTSDFAVFNNPYAKPDTQNKKAILLYTQKINEIRLYPTTLPQITAKRLTNCLPPIISMCPAQTSSNNDFKLIGRFHEIKKLITSATLDQLIIESFTRNNDKIAHYFLIRKLHCLNQQQKPQILLNVLIRKCSSLPDDLGPRGMCISTAYFTDSTIKKPTTQEENSIEEPCYYQKNYSNTKTITDAMQPTEEKKPLTKKEYDEILKLALSFKQQKNPHTYQKPLKALGKWMEKREE